MKLGLYFAEWTFIIIVNIFSWKTVSNNIESSNIQQNRINPVISPDPNPEKFKVAFCLTGQLARFEIISKIKNIFIPNAKIGTLIHNFILLGDQIPLILC
jgi:hypothetical protein